MYFVRNLPKSVDKNCIKHVPAPLTEAILNPFETNKNCHKNVPFPLTEAQLKELFMRFDTNRDGRLSKQELKNAFDSLGALIPSWRAYRALHHADRNGDRYISKDELDEVVNYALSRGYTVK